MLKASTDEAAAERAYGQALDVAKRQNAKAFELHAATILADLWSQRRKRTEARDLLAPVYDGFTEGFDAPMLRHAEALLRSLTTTSTVVNRVGRRMRRGFARPATASGSERECLSSPEAQWRVNSFSTRM